MTADGLTRAVREQIGLGRLLPLGGPLDGAWITEAAAGAVLAGAVAREVPGVRLTGVPRVALADPERAGDPVVPPPPGAVSPGPLRVSAGFAAGGGEPLTAVAGRLRAVLVTAAERLGLRVAETDLRVTDLLDGPPGAAEPVRAPRPPDARPASDPDESRAVAAALAMPGTARLTGSLGGRGRGVRIDDRADGGTLPRRHVRVELATVSGHRAVDVARGVRAAVRDALDHPTVAVLVTAVDEEAPVPPTSAVP
ncbi:nucleopolyhedrovirus P10 family protein [Streptomyces sp. J2-1]|uniref:nucleopolyhedrovirus P10 family protein n=1 Tax=Streptomyces corallincola TaxID=2851888 RepID=UPI001C392259|nr:nucleopolyhedrovirus P10 family protein [Streptomyces corallincola]MBV2355102.1 nucleopolyhedrovirus P10 family protein [Streptomyces corallincola]